MKTSTTKSITAAALLLSFISASLSISSECIVSGETQFATIEFPGETHSYHFYAEAGQAVVIEVADGDASWPPRVQLYDPSGRLVAEAVDTSYPYTYAAIEGCKLEMTGTYTIVVSYSGGTGDYGVSLVLIGGAMTSLEDRDGADLTPGASRKGMIAPYGDRDISVIFVSAGHGIRIEIADDVAGWPPYVQLYDPRGELVAEAFDASYPYTYAAIENYQSEVTGIYTIIVSYHGGTSEYGLSVSVMPPMDPHGLYPYDPQPADGQLIDYCDPNYQVADVVVENRILPDGSVVKRWSGGNLLSWCSVIGSTSYDVYFSASPCMPLEKIAENITDPYLPMPAVEDGQICSWRVVAHTPSEDIQGPTWWFVTECTSPCGLTIFAIGQGSIVDPNAGFHEYSHGQVVPVTAIAEPNYEFVRWEGTGVDAHKVVIEYQDSMGSQVSVTVDGTYTLAAVFEEIVYDFPLDSNPEWIMEGQWEFGAPNGQGGEKHGNPDPIGGYTGPNVLGVNLNGNYNVEAGPRYSLLAGPFDLSEYNDVNLRFARWLNIDEPRYVTANVDVSINGEDWFTLWESETEVLDSQWALVKYNLSDVANDKAEVYLRWTYQVVGERAYPYSGWNLDDIQLCGKRQ